MSIFETLEPRLLLSADVAPVMSGGEVIENFADLVIFDPAPDPSISYSEAASTAVPAAAAPFPLDQTFLLHSTPGASKVIYLDFDGHTTSGTLWNSSYTGGSDIISPAYSFQGDSSFSDAEKERIQGIWERVVEDYIPFDVDVTTEDPGSAVLMQAGAGDQEWGVRMVIGGDSSDWLVDGAGGVAYVGSFTWDSDTPAFVFSENLSSNEKYVAEAISHEAGHTLNLYHDGTNAPNAVEYYQGHGSGATGWAPIMGVGYYQDLVQWSKGEYSRANNTEDDLAIITGSNGFGYRTDDHGDTRTVATSLAVDGDNAVFDEGIIERNTDLDFFSFTTAAGTITLDIDPFYRSPNLDILASLYDSTGAPVATSNPSAALDANFNLPLLAGTYYLAVEGTGKGLPLDTGYSDYGSLGQYSISGVLSRSDGRDLGVADSDIDFDIVSPDDSDSVTISATIRNLGTTDLTDVVVRFYDGDPAGGGVQIDNDYVVASLGGLSSSVAQVAWAPDTARLYDIYVVVDPEDAFVEELEDNNTAHKSIFVADNDTDGPDIFNVVIAEHNGDGDGIIAADEQVRISWELTDSIARGLLVTEVSTGATNFVEIQNVWDQPVDATGWTVLLNDSVAPAPDITGVNSQAWTLSGAISPGQVLYRTEDPGDGGNYLGGGIQWDNDGPGWAMIIDDSGGVKDFAVWGYSSAQIGAMAIDYGPFTGITVGDQWIGDGAEIGTESSPAPPPDAAAITYTGGTYTENFDSMGSGGTAPPPGWVAGKYATTQNRLPPGSAPDDETLYVDDGSSKAQDRSYNYGTTDDSDRAIGSIPARKKGDRAIQLAITNDTGAEITELTLAYTGEQWRNSRTNALLPQMLSVWFSTDPGSGFVSMGSQFDFGSPSNGAFNSALDGNDPANRTEISGLYVPDAPILDGQTFYITWHDVDDRGVSDHGLAIDDVSVTPVFEPPNSFLERTGHSDNNTAADFVRNNDSTMGAKNPGLADSSGIGPVELLVDGAAITLDGDYYAVVGPLDSDGPAWFEYSFTINAADGDNSPTYVQFIDSFIVAPAEEITVIYEGLTVVSGEATPIDFGQVDQGASGVEVVFEVRNDGGQTLSLGEIIAPGGFSVTPPAAADIPAGGSTSFTVTLDTDTVGVFSGNVTLANSDGPQSPDGLDENPFTFAIAGMVGSSVGVVARHVFYNNSAWDAGGDDDAAIDPDKTPLLPGGVVTHENYTSFSRGINGIMVDIAGLNPEVMPDAGDFDIQVNAADDPDTWSPGPAPAVSIRSDVGGYDRVTLIWADGEILNRWVKVTVLSDAGGGSLGLVENDVFYLGNAIGDTDGDGAVGGDDYSTFRSEFGHRGEIGSLAADFNGNGRVDLVDFAIIRGMYGNEVEAPDVQPAAPPAAAAPAAAPALEPNVDILAASAMSDDEDVAVGGDVLGTEAQMLSFVAGLSDPAGGSISAIGSEAVDSTATTLHRTAVAAEDLRTLGDDLLAGGDDGLLVDVLAGSALVIPL